MTTSALEKIAAETLVDRNDADAACRATGRTLASILDEISLGIAERYMSGRISFEYADAVMNGLHDIILSGGDGRVASDFAWEVFLAFDAGEYRRHADDPEVDPEQKYTKPEVGEILRKYRNENGA